MHSLLARQLRRHFGAAAAFPQELAGFLDVVQAAYAEADTDRAMIERTMDLSSQELLAANADLRETLVRAKASEEQYRSLVDNSPNAIVVVGDDATVDLVNPAFTSMFGRSAASVVGQSVRSALGMPDLGEAHDFFSSEGAGGSAMITALVGSRADGTMFEMQIATAPFRDPQAPDRQCVLIEIRDVTEERALQRREARLAAAESERLRFAALAESLAAGVLVADADEIVTYCNSRYQELLGLESLDLVGQSLDELSTLLSPQIVDTDRTVERLREMRNRLHEHPSVELELAHTAARALVVTGFPIEDPSGDPLGVGFLVRDVTRERAIDRMKTEFVALASHELRTPLTGIYGFSQLLEADETLPEDRRKWAGHIHSEAARLTRIVEALLNVTSIDSGGFEVANDPVPLAGVLAEAIESARPGGEGHAIELSSARPVTVQGDRDKLTQVFHNLIENAVKYSPEGGTVRVSFVSGAGGVRVRIADEGIGIPAEEIPRLFERFYRAVTPGRENIRGTGLGLYIVHELVTRMGGQIEVESEVGRGSTFLVTLRPAAEERAA